MPIGTILEGTFTAEGDVAKQVVVETTMKEIDLHVVVNEVPVIENV